MSLYFKKSETFYWFSPSTSPEYLGYGYIKLSVIIDKKRSVFSTGVFCHKDHWQSGKLFRIEQEAHKSVESNAALKCIMERAGEINRMMRQKRIEPTAKKICLVLKYLEATEPEENCRVESKLYEELYEQDLMHALGLAEKRLSPPLLKVVKELPGYLELGVNTRKKYVSSANRLCSYLKHIKRTDMTAEEFTTQEATKMCDYLRTESKRQMAAVSIKRYMNHYRRALEYAKKRGYIKENPLVDFRYKGSSKKDLQKLTYSQLNELHLLQNLSSEMEKVRDAFLFMIYTSLHFIDYDTLVDSDITKTIEIDGSKVWWMEKKREKSKVEYCQKMHPFAVGLIEKYNDCKNLPRFNYRHMRVNVEELGKMIGYEKKLMLKTARKTFAFLCLNVWSFDLETTAKMMGLNQTDTIAFYAKVGRERVARNVDWNRLTA